MNACNRDHLNFSYLNSKKEKHKNRALIELGATTYIFLSLRRYKKNKK